MFKHSREPGVIYEGNNIKFLLEMESDYIDCHCIDPPFNSGRNYSNFEDNKAQWEFHVGRQKELAALKVKKEEIYDYIKNIKDDDSRSYCTFMAYRFLEMHRTLKQHGILIVICDDKEDHRIRVILDEIFGSKNHVNTIYYRRSSSKIKRINVEYHRSLNRNAGTIHIYAKNKDNYAFKPEAMERELKKKEIMQKFPRTDRAKRHYKLHPISGYGKEWDFYGITRKWNLSQKDMEEELENGTLAVVENGKTIIIKDKDHLRKIGKEKSDRCVYSMRYPNTRDGKLWIRFDNIWEDLDREQVAFKESGNNTGRKSEELMERILKLVPILPEDRAPIVMDCFAGSGTTLIVADRLGYEWIGIEMNEASVKTIIDRFDGKPSAIEDHLDPDYDSPTKGVQVNLFDFDEPSADNKKQKKQEKQTDFKFNVAEKDKPQKRNLKYVHKHELLEKHKRKDEYLKVDVKFWHDVEEASKEFRNWHESSLNARDFPKNVIRDMWIEQEFVCSTCNKALFIEDLTGDHIVPWSKGGQSTKENCQILCFTCNTKKGAKDQKEWLEHRKENNFYTYDKEVESERVMEEYPELRNILNHNQSACGQ